MRKFKLRNGAVVEETEKDKDTGFYWLEVIDFGRMSINGKRALLAKNELYLLHAFDNLPLGGAWGPEFDAVEELLED